MAVVDNYADLKWQNPGIAPSFVQKREQRSRGTSGADVRCLRTAFAIAASDSVLSVYRLFASVPAFIIPLQLLICNTAMAGTTGVDFGLYSERQGAVVAQTAFSTGLSLAAAHTSFYGTTPLNAYTADMTATTTINSQVIFNVAMRLSELAGFADNSVPGTAGAYDIGMKVTTSGGVAGTVAAMLLYCEG